jgi:Zn-dependent oligopeptidase
MKCSATGLNFTRTALEITQLSASLRAAYVASLDAIAQSSDRTFAATFGRLAAADDTIAEVSAEATLHALVAAEPERRAAGAAAKKELQDMFSAAYGRRDVYDVLQAAASESDNYAADATESRIASRYLALWTANGMALRDTADRTAVAEKSAAIATLAAEFEQAINEDTTAVSFDPDADLVGVPASLIDSLPRDASDPTKVLVGCKASQMTPVLQTCTVEATRKRLHLAATTRCPENMERLATLVRLRGESAQLLGHPNHAARALAVKMALTPEATHAFLDGVAAKLETRLADDLRELSAVKASLLAPSTAATDDLAPRVNAWDITFLSAAMKKQLGVDEERIKTYFPAAHVVPTAVTMVAALLGCEATARTDGAAWHESCEIFEITNKTVDDDGTDPVVGYVVLDLVTRPNKFGHQMVVPLRPALPDAFDGPRPPVCSVLGNLGDERGLLRFREVETLLHELGHVFHALCGDRGHSILSWSWPIVPWPGGVTMVCVWCFLLFSRVWLFSSHLFPSPSSSLHDALRIFSRCRAC